MLNWNCSKNDSEAINRIVARTTTLMKNDPDFNRCEFDMDITAVHCNGSPLDLEKLLSFDDFNFLHDVKGINRHIDRSTGELMDCFVPRSAAMKTARGGAIMRTLLFLLLLLLPLPAQAGTIKLAEFEWSQPEPITLPADYGFVVENIQHQPPAVWFVVVSEFPFNESASPALVERFNAITTNHPNNNRELRMHNDFQPINEFNRVVFDALWLPDDPNDGFRAEAFVPNVPDPGRDPLNPLYTGLWGYIVTGLDRTITAESQLVRVYGHPIPEPAAWLLVLFGLVIQWRMR